MTMLEAALEYLERGWAPIPLCWPDEHGHCACEKQHTDPKDVGKAPMLGKGHQDLRPTEADVRRWWSKWPAANIGLLLQPSRLLVLDCDSQQTLEKALALGLPPGPVVHTGRCQHRYFSANGTAGRSTTWLDSHVKASGYVVAPPSRHASGKQYAWALHPDDAEPQKPPAWVEELLSKTASRVFTATADDSEEPPVRLDEPGLMLWTGELAVDKADSKLKQVGKCTDVDRSETLYALGGWLARGGATSKTIADALAERDAELWQKYSERQDGGALEYARIAEKVLDELAEAEFATNLSDHEPGKSEPGTIDKGRSRFTLTEAEASELAQGDIPEEPPSLPLLEQEGYVLENWSHIVSGYPKSGKTELLFTCARDWAAEQTSLLWLSEESQYIWQRRLAGQKDFPAGLRIVFAMGADPAALLERASTGAESVVIVDTCRNLFGLSDEKDNSEVARMLTKWESVLTGKTRIYVHHDRKQGGEHGQAIAGAAAFLGVVDRAIEVKFDVHDRKRRQLVVHSRITEAPDLLYELTDSGLKALGDPEQVGFLEAQRRVLEVLDAEWRTTNDVVPLLGEPAPSARQVREVLGALFKTGQVQRDPETDKRGATYRWRVKK